VSLSGVGGLRVTTPLQHKRNSPQKEGTTRIHPCVSSLHSSVISSLNCILLFTCLLAFLSLIGNSSSYRSSEFSLCQAIKFKKIKN
jgi:hypothetical protein